MSKKDMLGQLPLALVGVPPKMLGLIFDIVNRLGHENGEIFYKALAKFVREWKKEVVGEGERMEQVEKLLDPDMFFRTREGLWVSDDFLRLVLAKAKSVEVDLVKTKHIDLPRDMYDSEIERELGENHLFTETEVCGIIADLISKQEGGKDGELLNNGHANLFYTCSCVVCVRWNAGDREWFVSAWRRGDRGWNAGLRAFSPAN